MKQSFLNDIKPVYHILVCGPLRKEIVVNYASQKYVIHIIIGDRSIQIKKGDIHTNLIKYGESF